MKGCLLDENLPSRLTFDPGLPAVSSTVLGSSPTDTQIWEHARREELAIVTKDADFSGRIILQDPPPWVVHLRFGKFGNMRRQEFHARPRRVWPQVATLLKTHKLVNVHADRVEGVS